MKTLKYIIPVLIFMSIIQISCSKDDENPSGSNQNTSSTVLTEDEKNDLLYMREEEKLARDIYLLSFDLYGLQIFSNISSSEQTHMDEILVLIEKYNLADPASPDRNVFNNPVLQNLFNELKVKSEKSLLDALMVGATIEDLDIYDLDNAVATTVKSDIVNVYEFLNCGSRNHMRAFTGQIDSNSGTYENQFLDDQKYQEILDSEHKKCGQL